MPTVTADAPGVNFYDLLRSFERIATTTLKTSLGGAVIWTANGTTHFVTGPGLTFTQGTLGSVFTGGTITGLGSDDMPGLAVTDLNLSAVAVSTAALREAEEIEPLALERLLWSKNYTFVGTDGNDVASPFPTLDGFMRFTGTNQWNMAGGTDTIIGGWGVDRMYGGAGSDSLYGNIGNDRIWGGSENDRLDGGDGRDEIHGDAGNDGVDGGRGLDSLYGGAGDDVLGGGSSRDTLYGGDGNDQLNGGDGDNVLLGGKDDDSLIGGQGEDEMSGGVGNDSLSGMIGSDTLWGGDGDDTLFGGSYDDTIQGGAGSDRLSGGGDSDTFLFASFADFAAQGRPSDVITDFQEGFDLIDLSRLNLTFIGGSDFSGSRQVRFVDALDVLLIDVDGNGTADHRILIQSAGGVTLTAQDLIL